LARLDQIRLGIQMNLGLGSDSFVAAFKDYGLPIDFNDVEGTAARIAKSRIRLGLLAALDHWILDFAEPEERQKLLLIVQAADEDPWRRQCWSACQRDDLAALMKLAEQPDAAAQPPDTLVFLCYALSQQFNVDLTRGSRYRKAAVKLLRQAQ